MSEDGRDLRFCERTSLSKLSRCDRASSVRHGRPWACANSLDAPHVPVDLLGSEAEERDAGLWTYKTTTTRSCRSRGIAGEPEEEGRVRTSFITWVLVAMCTILSAPPSRPRGIVPEDTG